MKREESNQVNRKFGAFIRNGRNERGLTQQEMAERVGMTQANYSRIENGQRIVHWETAKVIAEVLHLDLNDFAKKCF